jgi:hypothetical protein
MSYVTVNPRGENLGAICMADLAVGSLVPTGALAGLFVWLIGTFCKNARFNAPIATAGAANLAFFGGCALIVAYGLDDGGPPTFEAAFLAYLLPQIAWLVVWFRILKRRAQAAINMKPAG